MPTPYPIPHTSYPIPHTPYPKPQGPSTVPQLYEWASLPNPANAGSAQGGAGNRQSGLPTSAHDPSPNTRAPPPPRPTHILIGNDLPGLSAARFAAPGSNQAMYQSYDEGQEGQFMGGGGGMSADDGTFSIVVGDQDFGQEPPPLPPQPYPYAGMTGAHHSPPPPPVPLYSPMVGAEAGAPLPPPAHLNTNMMGGPGPGPGSGAAAAGSSEKLLYSPVVSSTSLRDDAAGVGPGGPGGDGSASGYILAPIDGGGRRKSYNSTSNSNGDGASVHSDGGGGGGGGG